MILPNTTLDMDDVAVILRALYWYQDKITNQERAKGRDDLEWDYVVFTRDKLINAVKEYAYIK